MTEAELKLAQSIYVEVVNYHADKAKFLNIETINGRELAKFSLEAAKVFFQIYREHKDD
jgi:hypothetical protein